MKDFKTNMFFDENGEDIESLLANYLISILNFKNR